MAVVEIILQARDNTAAGVNSARANLASLAGGPRQSASQFVLIGRAAADAARQITTTSAATAQSAQAAASGSNTVIAAQQRQATSGRVLTALQQQLARAQLQVRLASTDAAGRVSILSTEYTRLAAAARQAGLSQEQQARAMLNAARAQRQMITAQNVRDRGLGPALPRTLESFGTGALGQLGVGFGAAAVGQGLVSLARDSFNAANALEKTDATVRALSGSQQRYAEVLSIARTRQEQWGGSLQANLSDMQSLIPMSNNLGVALDSLDRTTQKLTIRDPMSAAGGGASLALREFLTASSTNAAEGAMSLRERFELDRTVLQDIIRSTSDATERLRLLNAELARQGIGDEALTAASQTRAAAFDRLGASVDNARDRLGALTTTTAAPLASWGAEVLAVLDGTTRGVERFAAAMDPLAGLFGISAPELAIGAQALMRQAGVLGPETQIGTRTPGEQPIRSGFGGPDAASVAPVATARGAQSPYLSLARTTPQTAGIAPQVNVTVQGSVIAERDLAETIRGQFIDIERRNGSAVRR